MKYAILLLAVFAIQGIRSQNCTRTNHQSNICAKPCNPSKNECGRNEDCICDGDCGHSCVKRGLHCPRLSRIDKGRVKLKNTAFRSVAKYQCRSPYKAIGSKKRTCRGNGTWDGQEPVCKLMCPVPPSILNGTMKYDSLEVGQKVTYTCSPGFVMEGRNTLTCARSGAWNRGEPKCVCKRTNREHWKFCRRQCNPSTSGSCRNNQECICDGDCGYSCVPKALECGRPSRLENGKQKYSSRRLGSVVKYNCNEPYTLIGPKKRTCRGIKRWDGNDPSCKIICKDPGDIDFGNKQLYRRNFEEDYLEVGDRVEYNCFPGYEMEGSKYLVCGSTGEWNKDKPKCKLPSCDPPQLPENVDFRLPHQKKTRSFKFQEKVLLKCQTGYFQNGIGLLTCKTKGKWTGSSFTCSPKSCGRPQIPLHGNVKSHVFTFRSKVYFECNPGFKLVGDKYRQCQANQKWSGRVPTCKLIDCGRLSTPHKVLIVSETGHTRLGGYVKYRCKEKGYELIGSETRVCQNDEQWSGVEPSCRIINCGNPDTPANVKQVSITNGFNYGSSVEFACEANYTLEGSKIIACGETKEWSSSAPSCLAPCLDPGEPGNGTRIGDDFTHGKFIKFQCDGDFEHVGEKTIQCLDGKWSHKIPQCKVISCGDPGTPTHGRQTNVVKNFAFRGIVEFQCDKGYTLNGKSSLSCQRNKTWDGDVPKCLVSCSYPDGLLHGINRKNLNCSIEKEKTSLEIMLPKENTITAASIQLGQDKGNVQQIQIKALLSNKWVNFGKPFKPHFNEGVKALKLPQPVITRFVQVLLFTRRRISSCLTPTLYGCDAVHRGCIMPGSAVLFKEGGTYRKGRFASVWGVKWEVVEGKRYKYLSKDDTLILDEKPNVNQLSEGTTVVGTDSRGKIKGGNIKRSCSSTHCPIETNGEEWQSKLENVRLFKGELCK
ncbi:protein lev-9 isoform X2 [Pocillopora verrucosa]|uniref:protein lev-9 isoform X2 n=1 Tax=Pocillopora verrucosa TaxID=203993 RepID=UPI00333EFF22